MVRKPHEGRLLLQMLGWRFTLPLLKRVVPLPALARLMWSDGRLPPRLDPNTVIRLAEVMYKPWPPGTQGNCLERSLIAYRYLARARAEPALVVGIDRSGGSVRGHVWVLLDGRPVHDSAEFLARHVPLVSFGADGRPTHATDSRPSSSLRLTDV